MHGLSTQSRILPRLRSLAIATLALLMLSLPAMVTCSCGKSIWKIGVFQYGPDPDTEAAYKGLIEGLREHGFTEGKNLQIDFTDCGKNRVKIAGTARRFASAELDAVVPLTTPCLVAAAKYVEDKPVVFTSVYDPMAAGVAKSPDEHPANVTGVYSPPPVEKTIDLIRACMPGVAVIGTVYNPSEPNSSSAVKSMEEYCGTQGISLAKLEVGGTEEVGEALEGFLGGRPQAGGPGNPQALYITGDNTVMGAFDDVVEVAGEEETPVFINDPGFVEKGAVAGIGPDFAKAGIAGGRLLADVLEGRNPATVPLQPDQNTLLYVNKAAAAEAGIQVPQSVLDGATGVFEETP